MMLDVCMDFLMCALPGFLAICAIILGIGFAIIFLSGSNDS